MIGMDDLLSELENIRLGAALSDSALHKLVAVVRPRVFADGQTIVLQGDVDAPVFFVVSGAVRTLRTNLDGREQNLIHLAPGAAFNVSAAFSDAHRSPASAVAIGPTRLLCIAQQDFGRVVGESPEISLAVLRDLSRKVYHLADLVYDLSLRTVRGRLARFLLVQAETPSMRPARWTQQEIAAQIGTVREVVSRTMRAFVKEGLIEMNRQRITIIDADALEAEV